jgi:hypothetical protein
VIIPSIFGGRSSEAAVDRIAASGELIGGLLLALVSAAAINLGFLLQHRGLRSVPSPRRASTLAWAMLRNGSWLSGQALGWAGFLAQIVAVSIAPLSLVQSFAAGGLALSVPLAAGLFAHRIPRRRLVAVVLTAAGLATLSLGLSDAGDQLQTGLLIASVAIVLVIALAIGFVRTAPLLAIAAGLLYGVADAAIKAVSVGWAADGSASLRSGWTVLAALATLGGFLAFQSALRAGGPISAISLMNSLSALVALGCGLIAFNESLGASPAAIVVHLLAIALVLGCVPVLASAQTEIGELAETGDPAWEQAAGGKQQALQPRARTRMAGPEDIAHP